MKSPFNDFEEEKRNAKRAWRSFFAGD